MPDYSSVAVYGPQYGFDPYASSDVGWFGSKLVKRATRVVKGAANVVSKVPGTKTLLAPVNVARDVARGRNVVRSVVRQGRVVVADTRRALPVAASVVSFVPGAGTVLGSGLNSLAALSEGKSIDQIILAAAQGAIPGGPIAAAALGAMRAGLSGASLAQIAEAAARGALPREITTAIDLSRDVIRGKNLATIALNTAAKAFVPGSEAEKGFGQAAALLKRGAATVNTLKQARATLTSEEARRAFDSAVGTVSQAAEQLRRKPLPKLSQVPSHIAQGAVSRALPRFRSVTPRGAQVLANRVGNVTMGALFGRRETAGLEQDGKVYRVENGDSAWKIAKNLVGDGNRWKELVKANPKKPTAKDGNFKTLFAGEALQLPGGWVKPLAQTLAADVLSQARAILKVWSTSDGANEAGVTNYGDKPEDSSLTWGPRDRLMLISFLHWLNTATPNANLPELGDLSTQAADALRAWLARHSSTPPTQTNTTAWEPARPPVIPDPTPAAQPVLTPPTTPQAPVATAPIVGADPVTYAPTPGMGADVIAGWQAATNSGLPATMRMYANEMRKKGFPEAADKLDRDADALEAQQFGVPNSNTVPVTVSVPKPTTAAAAPAKSDGGAGLLLVGAIAVAKLAGMF